MSESDRWVVHKVAGHSDLFENCHQGSCPALRVALADDGLPAEPEFDVDGDGNQSERNEVGSE